MKAIASAMILFIVSGCGSQFVPEIDSGIPDQDTGSLFSDAPFTQEDSSAVVADEDAGMEVDAVEPDAFACGPRSPTPCPDASAPEVDAGTDAGSARPDAFAPDAGPPPDRTTIIQFALGTEHTCLLRASGVVRCWGTPGIYPATPVTNAVEIAAVGNQTYARLTDGSVRQWLGTSGPTSPAASMPPAPPTITEQYGCDGEPFPYLPYAEVYGRTVSSEQTGCGRRENGSVFCWGTNRRGEIGRDTGMFTHGIRCGEVLLDGARMDAIAIGRGFEHSCAALRDGSVVCWGSNNAGQLGTWVPGLQTFEPVEPDSFLY